MTEMIVTASYEELVARGREAREAADDLQWIEGDLALEINTLPADERPRDSETGLFIADEAKVLKRYADDIEVNYSSLQDYRRTAIAWPSPQRCGEVSWYVHRALAGQEDRFELIRPDMTTREAEQLVRDRRRGATGKPGWFELLGWVGDHLIAAEKAMGKAEKAIDPARSTSPRQWDKLQDKATKYAEWAEALAERLRALDA